MSQYNLKHLVLFIIYCQIINNVSSLNILVIVSLPLRSHYMAFQRLFSELAVRGHSVTVLNNFPDKNPPQNLTFVNLDADKPERRNLPPMSEFETINPTYLHLFNFYKHFLLSPNGAKIDCENFFINENVKSIREKKTIYDVIFVEQFMSDCGLAFALSLYDAPVIGITSHTLLPWSYRRLGIPFDFGADSFYFSSSGVNPSFYNKVESFLMDLFFNTINRWYIHRNIYEVFNKYLPDVPLNIEKSARERMKMMFVYQHHSITGTRLLTPQVLEIGGVHIRKPNAVPEKIENFLQSAEYGVIYVSFGSYLRPNTMTAKKIQQFLKAFKKIPQKVLWKLENMTLPAGNDNVFIYNWFPQLDVLCHPKVLAFISHGGMLSMSEAAYCGKPLVAIPFFGDQFSNAAAVEDVGLGIKMDFGHLNADTLAVAVNQLTSKKMQENAKRISKLWHDRPQDVLESAIYWTEYVARHKTSPSSLPSSRNIWFQFSLIDVYFVLGGILILTILIIYIFCKLIKRLTALVLFKVIKKKKE